MHYVFELVFFAVVGTGFSIRFKPHHQDNINDELYRAQIERQPVSAELLPQVKFNCKDRPPGYYADPSFQCEVFHYCHEDGTRVTIPCNHENHKHRICLFREVSRQVCGNREIYLNLPGDLRIKEAGITTASALNGATDFKLPRVLSKPVQSLDDETRTTPLSFRFEESPKLASGQLEDVGLYEVIESFLKEIGRETETSAKPSTSTLPKASSERVDVQSRPRFDISEPLGIDGTNDEALLVEVYDKDSQRFSNDDFSLYKRKAKKLFPGSSDIKKTPAKHPRRKKRMVVEDMSVTHPYAVFYVKVPDSTMRSSATSSSRKVLNSPQATGESSFGSQSMKSSTQSTEKKTLAFAPAMVPADVPTVPIAIETRRKKKNKTKKKPKPQENLKMELLLDESASPFQQTSEQQNVFFYVPEEISNAQQVENGDRPTSNSNNAIRENQQAPQLRNRPPLRPQPQDPSSRPQLQNTGVTSPHVSQGSANLRLPNFPFQVPSFLDSSSRQPNFVFDPQELFGNEALQQVGRQPQFRNQGQTGTSPLQEVRNLQRPPQQQSQAVQTQGNAGSSPQSPNVQSGVSNRPRDRTQRPPQPNPASFGGFQNSFFQGFPSFDDWNFNGPPFLQPGPNVFDVSPLSPQQPQQPPPSRNRPQQRPQQLISEPRPQQFRGEPRPQQFSGEPRPQQFSGEPRPQQFSGEPRPQPFRGEPRPQQVGGEIRPEQLSGSRPPQTPGIAPRPQQLNGEQRPQQFRGEPRPQQLRGEPRPQQFSSVARPQPFGGETRPQQFPGDQRRPLQNSGPTRPQHIPAEPRPQQFGSDQRPPPPQSGSNTEIPQHLRGQSRPQFIPGPPRPPQFNVDPRPPGLEAEQRPQQFGREPRPQFTSDDPNPHRFLGQQGPQQFQTNINMQSPPAEIAFLQSPDPSHGQFSGGIEQQNRNRPTNESPMVPVHLTINPERAPQRPRERPNPNAAHISGNRPQERPRSRDRPQISNVPSHLQIPTQDFRETLADRPPHQRDRQPPPSSQPQNGVQFPRDQILQLPPNALQSGGISNVNGIPNENLQPLPRPETLGPVDYILQYVPQPEIVDEQDGLIVDDPRQPIIQFNGQDQYNNPISPQSLFPPLQAPPPMPPLPPPRTRRPSNDPPVPQPPTEEIRYNTVEEAPRGHRTSPSPDEEHPRRPQDVRSHQSLRNRPPANVGNAPSFTRERPALDQSNRPSDARDRHATRGERPSSNKDKILSVSDGSSNTRHKPSPINDRPSSIRNTPPNTSDRPSNTRNTLPNVNERPSSNRKPPDTRERPAAAINKPSDVRDRPSSLRNNPSNARDKFIEDSDKPSSAIGRPVNNRPSLEERPSSIRDQHSTTREKPTSIRDRPTTIRDRPTTIRDRPTTRAPSSEITERPSRIRSRPLEIGESPSSIRNKPSGTDSASYQNSRPSSGSTNHNDDPHYTRSSPSPYRLPPAEEIPHDRYPSPSPVHRPEGQNYRDRPSEQIETPPIESNYPVSGEYPRLNNYYVHSYPPQENPESPANDPEYKYQTNAPEVAIQPGYRGAPDRNRQAYPQIQGGFQPVTQRTQYYIPQSTAKPIREPVSEYSSRERIPGNRYQDYNEDPPTTTTTTKPKPKPIPPRPTFPTFPTFPPPPRRLSTTPAPKTEPTEVETETTKDSVKETEPQRSRSASRYTKKPYVASSVVTETPGLTEEYDQTESPEVSTKRRSRKRRPRPRRPKTTTLQPEDDEDRVQIVTEPTTVKEISTRQTTSRYNRWQKQTGAQTKRTTTTTVAPSEKTTSSASEKTEEYGSRLNLFGRPRTRKPAVLQARSSITTPPASLIKEESQKVTKTPTYTRTRKPLKKRLRAKSTTTTMSPDHTDPIARSDEDIDSLHYHSENILLNENDQTSLDSGTETMSSADDAVTELPQTTVSYNDVPETTPEDVTHVSLEATADHKHDDDFESSRSVAKKFQNRPRTLKFGKPRLRTTLSPLGQN